MADGLSHKLEGLPHTVDDSSKWTISKVWETQQGLICDIFVLTTPEDLCEPELHEWFKDETLFLQVINAILGQDQGTSMQAKKCVHHRVSEYFIEDGHLWRLGGHSNIHARAHVECLTHKEAQAQAYEQHVEGSHWGRDHVKLNIMDHIWCPGLDTCIMTAIHECLHCKNFGAHHLHSLLELITCCHPFELLVGNYLSMPPGKGGFKTLRVYLNTFLQHVWVFMYKKPGSAANTIDSLEHIFKMYMPPKDFMSDGGSHFHCREVHECCETWNVKPHVIASYLPWVNGLVGFDMSQSHLRAGTGKPANFTHRFQTHGSRSPGG
ncbi:hypothetical protein EWM64_g10793 [Hericium alpestre]|uniref:Integrase catalytic domain-containing protein n=1 Tax=Hericium alpestre TaxID=135208 RepID=A0A4Y9ZIF0_9AGAM|nr:hypothetical protein EWM64_g10793 [Hericium alpestre]